MRMTKKEFEASLKQIVGWLMESLELYGGMLSLKIIKIKGVPRLLDMKLLHWLTSGNA